jgi:hypothetical protein
VDDDLRENAGQLVGFIGFGLVARADLDHQIAHADALPRVEAEVAGEAVALVEHADHRDAISHRSGAGKALGLGADRALHRRAAAEIVRRDGRGFVGRGVTLNGDRRRPAEDREAGEDREAAVHSGLHAS